MKKKSVCNKVYVDPEEMRIAELKRKNFLKRKKHLHEEEKMCMQ